ncbi:MAG: SHOCT domain-containing protein [Frankia sp.]
MNYPLLNVFLTMLWFFGFVLWIYLLFLVVSDIFRSRDLSGLGKSGWLLLVILLPLLGILVYLVARGDGMNERAREQMAREEATFSASTQATAKTPSTTEELTRLVDLREHGAINEAEFQREKTRILA